jgi:voltage-gated potassium channel
MPEPGPPVDRWVDRRYGSRMLRPRNAAFLIAGIWLVAVVVFGILVRIVDSETFDSVWLAFWWALQTVTTVGYGDVVPGDTSGKVMGAVLMLVGLSFITVITATITSVFVARRQRELQEAGDDPIMRRLEQIGSQLDVLQGELRRLRDERRPPAP